MNKYKLKINTVWLKGKRDSLVKKLASIGPFVDGSIAKVKRRCGNKNCKCYLKGEKHESYCLMYKAACITKAVYIPVDMLDEVIALYKEYKRLKRIIAEIKRVNKEIIRRHVSEKRQKIVKEFGSVTGLFEQLLEDLRTKFIGYTFSNKQMQIRLSSFP